MDLNYIVDGLPPKRRPDKCCTGRPQSSTPVAVQERPTPNLPPREVPLKDNVPRPAMVLVPALTPYLVNFPGNVCSHPYQPLSKADLISGMSRSSAEQRFAISPQQLAPNVECLHSIPLFAHTDTTLAPVDASYLLRHSLSVPKLPPPHVESSLKHPPSPPGHYRTQSTPPLRMSSAESGKRQRTKYRPEFNAPYGSVRDESKVRRTEDRSYPSSAPASCPLRKDHVSWAKVKSSVDGTKLSGSQNLNEHILVLDSVGSHRNQVNIKSRQYICQDCGRSFFRKSDLVRHLQIHLDIKPNMCDVCGKKFIQRSALTVHQRVHTGEKPYSCPVCSRAFSDSSSLARHRRIHLRDSEANPSRGESCFSRRQFESPVSDTANN